MINKMFYPYLAGSLLPDDPWEGRVQSVYSKAVNLLHPEGILISFVDSIEQMTDYGILISNFESFLSVISTGASISFNGTSFSSSNLTVHLSQSKVWNGQCDQLLKGSTFDISPIKRAFLKVARVDGLAPLIVEKVSNIYSNAAEKIIEKAIVATNISGSSVVDLSSLVGLGIGFTPSGDDFLAGVMLFEAISGTYIINRESIKDKLSGTTEGGRTLLLLALENSFPYYLKNFAEAIISGNFSLDKVVKHVIAHGSTSGSDALTGFIWASEKNKRIIPN